VQDCVRYAAQQIKALCPTLGKTTISDSGHLARHVPKPQVAIDGDRGNPVL
jgi:hypothetical protein